jgi:hypothetical protein
MCVENISIKNEYLKKRTDFVDFYYVCKVSCIELINLIKK